MQVSELMTTNVACCTPDTGLGEVAQMMQAHDCGCVPVVDSLVNKRVVGVVTDRDIVLRAVAQGRNPLDLTADDVMTRDVFTGSAQMSVEDCCNLMEQQQVRRVPVVDERGSIVGIVAQADVALQASQNKTAEVVKEVSQPTR